MPPVHKNSISCVETTLLPALLKDKINIQTVTDKKKYIILICVNMYVKLITDKNHVD